MADITITAASVVPGTNAKTKVGVRGATVNAGDVVYLDTADNRIKVADADNASALVRTAAGIALNSGATGQPVTYLYQGRITIGGTVVVGAVYCLSDEPGKICPVADLVTGDYVSVIGVGVSATEIDVNIQNGGVAIP